MKIREFLKGKKAYLTALAGIITAVIAWAEGSLNNTEVITAIFGALSVVFLRSGIANDVSKAVKTNAEKAD